MKHRNHVNVNNYRLATISPFLTYVYHVRTPLISLLLKAMYLYHRYVWTGPYDAPPFFSFFLDVASRAHSPRPNRNINIILNNYICCIDCRIGLSTINYLVILDIHRCKITGNAKPRVYYC